VAESARKLTQSFAETLAKLIKGRMPEDATSLSQRQVEQLYQMERDALLALGESSWK
jgi:hypothetical protein